MQTLTHTHLCIYISISVGGFDENSELAFWISHVCLSFGALALLSFLLYIRVAQDSLRKMCLEDKAFGAMPTF
ncbi:hypothetical protein TSAR_011256 [Trichomalopsis sarcophagae]|uniref:Uncharacterized protein n=1 Tax=Trichomalopsis sarcophagae TaxID=543379 RepID=A0A232FAK9_9HYME|nr:hypothetical protein TSAR_011256 [Trichomalopsis sarcophagae]